MTDEDEIARLVREGFTPLGEFLTADKDPEVIVRRKEATVVALTKLLVYYLDAAAQNENNRVEIREWAASRMFDEPRTEFPGRTHEEPAQPRIRFDSSALGPIRTALREVLTGQKVASVVQMEALFLGPKDNQPHGAGGAMIVIVPGSVFEQVIIPALDQAFQRENRK